MKYDFGIKFIIVIGLVLTSNILSSQNNLNSIIDQILTLKRYTINEQLLKRKIQEDKPNRFQIDEDKEWLNPDINSSMRISYMYAEINELDSAFHYLNESRSSKYYKPHLTYFPPPVNMLLDKRFDLYLDTVFNSIRITEDSLGNPLNYDMSLYKELKIYKIIDAHLRSLERTFSNRIDYFDLKDSVKLITKKLIEYKNTRINQFLKEQGFPKKAEFTPFVSNNIYNHLLFYSRETIINNIDYFENLGLQGEINSSIASLVDELLISTGKKQKYGTQLFYLGLFNKYVPFPIKDKTNVDKRRKKIGLYKTLEESINSKTLEKRKRGY